MRDSSPRSSSPFGHPLPRASRFLALWLAALAAVLLVACEQIRLPDNPDQTGGVTAGPQRTVALHVAQGPGGSVMALIPVYIQGEGALSFALDTGASQSVVDRDLLDRLNLQVLGQAPQATGVSGTVQGVRVKVDRWRIGDVELPATEIIAIDLPDPDRGRGIHGLLGSDILSNFGAVTVDYEREVLVLRARSDQATAPAAPTPAP